MTTSPREERELQREHFLNKATLPLNRVSGLFGFRFGSFVAQGEKGNSSQVSKGCCNSTKSRLRGAGDGIVCVARRR